MMPNLILNLAYIGFYNKTVVCRANPSNSFSASFSNRQNSASRSFAGVGG